MRTPARCSTPRHRRGPALTPGLAVVVALLLVAAPLPLTAGPAGAATAAEPDPAGARPAPELSALLRPVTGVRPQLGTVLGGGVTNRTDRATPVTVELRDLPPGLTIGAVRPDATVRTPTGAPGPGPWWSCDGPRCILVDDAGPASLPAGGDVPLLVSLDGDPGRTTEVTVALTGATTAAAAPRPVPLVLPAGEVAPDGIAVSAAGPGRAAPGTPVTYEVSVANVDDAATTGPLTVELGPAATAATGPGWACAATTCTTAAAVPPLGRSTPITVTVAAPTTGEVTLPITAAGTLGGPTPRAVSASTSRTLAASAPTGSTVSVRVALSEASVAPPARPTAIVSVTGTGAGPVVDPVTVTLAATGVEDPRDVAVDFDWDAATGAAWRCSARDRSCVSTAPLPDGEPTTLSVPVEVAADARPGTVHVTARTEVAGTSDEARAGLAVNPPPVPELRATLTGGTDAAARRGTGAALTVQAGRPAPLAVAVTNHGSRPAPAGSTVVVTARPDAAVRLDAAGGDDWDCGRVGEVSPRRELRCQIELREPLASDATIEAPLTLAAPAPGSWVWTVDAELRAGGRELDAAEDAAADLERGAPTARRFTVRATDDAPRLVPSVPSPPRLVRGLTAPLEVSVANRGATAAEGAVVVVGLPAGVAVGAPAAPWTCGPAGPDRGASTVACTSDAAIPVGATAASLTLPLTATGRRGEVSVGYWATTGAQVGGATGGRVTLRVDDAPPVSAGRPLTVVTPTPGADGVPAPAVVVLRGEVAPSLRDRVRWSQVCDAGPCPPVRWLDVAAGEAPRTVVARFTAPDVTGPTTLTFRLSAGDGPRAPSATVTVELLPAAGPAGSPAAPAGTGSLGSPTAGTAAPSGAGPDGGAAPTGDRPAGASGSPSDGSRAGSDGTARSAPGVATTVPAPPPPAPQVPPSVTVGGGVLQVVTRAPGRLTATAGGTGPFTYAWQQTGGPPATVVGPTDAPSLSFTAPSLAPTADGAELTFEVTVSSPVGTATATAAVDVVWGDAGLQVQIAGNAPSLVASTGTPVSVTSAVLADGAPYQYRWSTTGGLTLPPGTATDAPTLAFTAPPQPAEGTVSLQVTDSFGRVTTVSVPLSVTALPPGVVPAAFCAAVADLAAGRAATLAAADGTSTVLLPSPGPSSTGAPAPAPVARPSTTAPPTTTAPTTTTTQPPAPAPACAPTPVAVSGVVATLPGGVTVTGATGTLSPAGVTLATGTVLTPAGWSTAAPALPPSGVLVPFATSTALGSPIGALGATGVPFTQLDGWSAATTLSWSPTVPGAALVAVTATGPSAASLTATGRLSGSGTTLAVSSSGLVAVAGVPVPVTGNVAHAPVAAPAGPTVPLAATPATWSSTVGGSVAGVPLATDVTLVEAEVAWTPTATTGSATVGLGSGLTVSGPLAVTGADAVLTFDGAPLALGGPALTVPVSGRAAFTAVPATGSAPAATALALSATSPATGPYPAGTATLSDLTAAVTADCTLVATAACGAQLALTAGLALPGAPAPVTVAATGAATGAPNLTGPVDSLAVAPLSVTAGTATVVLGAGGPAAVVTGTATVAGAPRPTTVSFAGPPVAVAALGDLTPAPGWGLTGAVAVATAATGLYAPTPTSPAVTVTAGALTGVASVALPAAVAAALPPALAAGTASFALDGADPPLPPPTFAVALPSPGGWVPVGRAGAPIAVAVDALALAVAVTGTSTSTSASGAATLDVVAVPGAGGSTATPALLSGSIAGGVLSATVSAGDVSGWAGVPDLDLSDVEVALGTGSGGSATLTATASLPASLVAALGVPTPAAVTASADLTAAAPCLAVDLAPAGGIDVGSVGLVRATTAELTVAAEPCATPSAAPAPSGPAGAAGPGSGPGVTLSFASAELPATAVPLAVDGGGFTGNATLDLGAVTVGGLPLTGTELALALSGAAAEVGVSGSTDVAGTTLAVSGTAVTPTDPVGLGTLTLDGPAGSLQFGAAPSTLQLDGSTVAIEVASYLGAGAPSLTVSGTTVLLGDPVAVSLTGTTGGSSTSLTGAVPPQRFSLDDGDALDVGFDVSVDATTGVSITSPAGSATLTTPTRTFSGGSVTLTADGFDLTASTTVPGSLGLPTLAVVGSYPTQGPAAGAYSFTNPSAAEVNLSGVQASATATFDRPTTSVTESATMTATVPLGLFDGDANLPVSGTIAADGTTTLTGSLQGVTFRGLAGDATVTIAPGDPPGTGTGWYTTAVELDTAAGDCDMWSGAPDLTGGVYRTAGTTYYTLTGTASLDLPEGIDIVVGQYQQPVVLTNEYPSDDPQPANGLTLALGFDGTAFTAVGSVSFAPQTCGYTIAADITPNFDSGPQGEAAGNALSPTSGLQDQVGNPFGPGGAPPADLLTYRDAKESAAYAAALVQLSQQALAQSAAATKYADGANSDLADALSAYEDAQTELAAARQALADALDGSAAASPEQLADAEDALEDAESDSAGSEAAVAAAQSRLEDATNASNLAQALADDAQQTAELAGEGAADAQAAAEQSLDDLEREQQQRVPELLLSWTHCDTCDPVDDVTVDGEILFANTYVLGADLVFGFGDGAFDSLSGSVTGGFERQLLFGWSWLNVFAEAEATVTITVGYDFVAPPGQQSGWNTLEVQASVEGQLDVNLDTWLVTYSATLADVSGDLDFSFLPSATWQGDFYFQLLGFSYDPSFGPDAL